jgi:hypothetical protein
MVRETLWRVFMIKVGQIRTLNAEAKAELEDRPEGTDTFVISNVCEDGGCFIIMKNGYSWDTIAEFIEPRTDLIAEYPTWQEAVNSKEFKGE